MHSGQDWLAQEDLSQQAYDFFMRVDPNMRDFTGPVVRVEDEMTGRQMRTREARVALIRGAAEEHMKPMTVYLDPMPHIRQPSAKDLQAWYQPKHNEKRGSRERPCMTDAILTQPYGGYCPVGCQFCYINAGPRGYRGSGLVTVPLNYGDHVRKQLKSMRSSQAGYFSSFTDPFLPLEDWYHNTQNGAQAFVDEGLPVFFLSRLHYPGWAFDMLQKNPLSYMQKSINTPDPDDWKKLSPGAISLEEHLAEIREAHALGIYVSIQVNPIVAGIVTHEDVEQLFGMLAEVGTDHVIVKFVEADFPWAESLKAKIRKQFGDNRSAAFDELFVENQCGAQKTITEAYRREGHERYRAAATRLGLTYATCYEYGRTDDGGWRSIGADYLTGDTCHGHRVPFHTRSGPEERFAPLGACQPSGCLSCADDSPDGMTGKCGSKLLGSAKALRIADLRADPGLRPGA